MTLHDLQIQIEQLKGEKDEMNRLNEELIQKLTSSDPKLQTNVVMSTNREETTCGNLPTGLSARSPTTAMPMPTRDSERLLSQGTLQQVQSIDYMVLDLNAVK